jgi:predicted nuclease with TOPRIM domain
MNQLINSLIAGGIGAALGSIAVALINVFAKKGESRATAADLVTNAAGGLIDRLEKDNARLHEENKKQRSAIITLTDVVDELIPACNLSPDDKARLRKANHDAKMVV